MNAIELELQQMTVETEEDMQRYQSLLKELECLKRFDAGYVEFLAEVNRLDVMIGCMRFVNGKWVRA